MMSNDINFVTFMMFSDFCLIDSTVELVSPGMLQYAVRCRACPWGNANRTSGYTTEPADSVYNY